jgi:hypothetical protein
MGYARSVIFAALVSQAFTAAALAGESTSLRDLPVVVTGHKDAGQHTAKDARMTTAAPLDRVATAVDGAESSHGKDLGMWRPDPSGPQGPMQVSEAAATDVGGGDRFDLTQNRAIGRAYLAQLYSRYQNWPDAIAAYNWGLGKMDAWVKAGRPPDKFVAGVAVYLRRVLYESGLCGGSEAHFDRQRSQSIARTSRSSSAAGNQIRSEETEDAPVVHPADSMINAACSAPDGSLATGRLGIGPSRFSKKLDQALQLALQRTLQSR